MIRLFLIALRNIAQHRRRTVMLLLAVAAVTALLVLVRGALASIRTNIYEAATTVVSGDVNVGGFFKRSATHAVPVVTEFKPIDQIVRETIPESELEALVERRRGFATLSNGVDHFWRNVVGLDVAREGRTRALLDIREGSFEDLGRPNSILLFRDQAKKLGVRVGDVVTLSGRAYNGATNALDVRVVAIADNGGLISTLGVLVSNDTLKGLFQFREDSTGALQLYLKDRLQIVPVQERLRAALEKAGYRLIVDEAMPWWQKKDRLEFEAWTGQRLDVTTWEDEMSGGRTILVLLGALTTLLTFVLLAIVSVGLMNILWLAVRERTPEIGALRCIGMQRRKVVAMFLAEGLLLGALGAAVGVLLAALGAGVINALRLPVSENLGLVLGLGGTLALKIDSGMVIESCALIVISTTVISLFPSTLAARLKPLTALSPIR